MFQLIGVAKDTIPGHPTRIEENINLSGPNEQEVTKIGFSWARERANRSILEVKVWRSWLNARGGVDRELLYVLDTDELIWHFAK